MDSKLFRIHAKMDFTGKNTLRHGFKESLSYVRKFSTTATIGAVVVRHPENNIAISPWRKSANHHGKNQPPNLGSGTGQSHKRSSPLRRFSSGSKARCLRSAVPPTGGCRPRKGLPFSHRLICKTRNTHICFFRHLRQARPDSGGGLTPRNIILPVVGITTSRHENF